MLIKQSWIVIFFLHQVLVYTFKFLKWGKNFFCLFHQMDLVAYKTSCQGRCHIFALWLRVQGNAVSQTYLHKESKQEKKKFKFDEREN